MVEISSDLLDKLVNIVVDFEYVDRIMRRLKSTRLAQDFQRYNALLKDLGNRYENMKSNFKGKMHEVIPKVKAKKLAPSALTEMLTEYKQSPYEKENFLILLSTRQKEIETAEYIIYHPELPSNKFIDLDHTGDMAECIIGHGYTVAYNLDILPYDIDTFGNEFENKGMINEEDKWFMDEAKLGDNRFLMKDFLELSGTNVKNQFASVCFLISLNPMKDEKGAFALNLLKSGEIFIKNFKAPKKIWKIETMERKMDSVKIKVYHDPIEETKPKSPKYQLQSIYKLKRKHIGWDSILPQRKFFSEKKHGGDFEPKKTFSIITFNELDAGSIYEVEFTISIFDGNNYFRNIFWRDRQPLTFEAMMFMDYRQSILPIINWA